ncbi:MAG: TPR repeat-containing protein [Ignavibacteria bacterium]|nr:MAG: TPR repeat-containing protein [Ignavibacteria bacterium]KAF0156417.1 MAG: TPR repeat-containing protein [Ignavibacteria bacterium]
MFYFNSNKLFALILFALLAISFSGCGVYRNFTTYFNTYYNAKTIFDQAEEDIQKKKVDVFAFREDMQAGQQLGGQSAYQNRPAYQQSGYRSEQTYGGAQQSQFGSQSGGGLYSGNTSQDLTKVIEKCSKILQYQKESAFFIDALFMTGKALYYQQEYSKAQRKFTELAGLGETEYANENKLWLAKTNLQLRNFDEGLKQLEEVKAKALENEEEKLFTEASITKISFLIFRNDIPQAVTECKNYIQTSENDEMKGLVSYQLGRLYQILSDEQNALETYSSVLNYSPTLEVEVSSKLERARLLKELDRIEESEDELSDMRDQGKYKNNLDEINIDLAQIYFDTERYKEAVDLLKDVDTTYRALPTSGIACMRLGEVYERGIMDYDSSYKYYKKVVPSLAPIEYRNKANERSNNFDKYFALKKKMYELNKQLVYVRDPRVFERDSIDYAMAYKEYDEEKKKQEEITKNASMTAGTQQSQEAQRALMEQQQKQQEFLKEIERKKRMGINEQIPLKILISLGQVEKPERPQGTESAVKSLLAANMFEQGSLFFSELDHTDSAYIYFSRIINDVQDSTIIPKTLFSLATYYETKNDTVKADELYKEIYNKYPKDKLHQTVGEKLGLVKKEEKKNAANAEDPAEPLYIKAEELYYKNNYAEAIDSFKAISKNFPKSTYSPKAIYYTGLIYEEQKNYDSAAVAYAMLEKDFAPDPVSKLAIAKYTEYKNEKEKIRKAEEDKKKEEELKKKDAEEKLNTNKTKQEDNKVDKGTPNFVKDSTAVSDTSKFNIIDTTKKKQSYLDRLKADSDTTRKVIVPPVVDDDAPVTLKTKSDSTLQKKDSLVIPNKSLTIPKDKPDSADTTKKEIKE